MSSLEDNKLKPETDRQTDKPAERRHRLTDRQTDPRGAAGGCGIEAANQNDLRDEALPVADFSTSNVHRTVTQRIEWFDLSAVNVTNLMLYARGVTVTTFFPNSQVTC